VSTSWIRRHAAELPHLRLGRLVRFDSQLLTAKFRIQFTAGKPLPEPERNVISPMKARWQQGSVYRSNGMWYGRYRADERDADGNLRRRCVRVRLGAISELPTKSAASRKLAHFLGQTANNQPQTRMTFATLVERWKQVVVPSIKASSAQHYQNSLRLVMPLLCDADISTLTRFSIERLLVQQSRQYSRNTLRTMRASMSCVFGWAESNGWIHQNPCNRIKIPRSENCGGRTVARHVISHADVVRLSEALPEPYATLVIFLFATGMRISEAAGLMWSDLQAGVVHVQRRIYNGQMDALKTKGSNRRLPLPADLLTRLEALQDHEGYIFHVGHGAPLNRQNAMNRHVGPAAKKLGIQMSGWHDLRHSLATHLRRSGAHPKVVSGILGHSGVTMALDIYDHLSVADMQAPLATESQRLSDLCQVASANAVPTV